MDKEQALRQLNSPLTHDRLIAARYLSQNVEVSDRAAIEQAMRREDVVWIRNALRAALDGLERPGGVQEQVPDADIPESEAMRAVRNEVLRENTALLLHEINPILGILKLNASREVPNYADSKTAKSIDDLDKLLEGISRLRQAAEPAKLETIDVSELISDVITQSEVEGVVIQSAGPKQFSANAGPTRLRIALSNGLRNAVEATLAVDEGRRAPIVVNWERTDSEYWIAIIDGGVGYAGDLQKAFDIGRTSKRGHFGMGLAAALAAMETMGGQVALYPRASGGIRFELRWPVVTLSR